MSKILIIEDDKQESEIFADVIRQLKYDADYAATAAEGMSGAGAPRIFRGMTRCPREGEKLVPEDCHHSGTSRALAHLGPGIPGRLRPRRACFRFSGQSNCSMDSGSGEPKQTINRGASLRLTYRAWG